MKVGWIGLGQIGVPMALRILQSGHDLKAFIRKPGEGDEVQAAGASACGSGAEAAIDVDILGVCLFADRQIHQALILDGALAAMRANSVVMIHTTGDPDLFRRLSAHAPAGVKLLDAAFSGDRDAVLAGRIAVMAGGEAQALAAARPVLEAYAACILHVGALGDGRRAKLLNNLLFAAQMSLAAEIRIQADRWGLDADLTVQAVMTSSGASYALSRFQGGAKAADLLERIKPYLDKDVAMACAALGDDVGELPFTVAAAGAWR